MERKKGIHLCCPTRAATAKIKGGAASGQDCGNVMDRSVRSVPLLDPGGRRRSGALTGIFVPAHRGLTQLAGGTGWRLHVKPLKRPAQALLAPPSRRTYVSRREGGGRGEGGKGGRAAGGKSSRSIPKRPSRSRPLSHWAGATPTHWPRPPPRGHRLTLPYSLTPPASSKSGQHTPHGNNSPSYHGSPHSPPQATVQI